MSESKTSCWLGNKKVILFVCMTNKLILIYFCAHRKKITTKSERQENEVWESFMSRKNPKYTETQSNMWRINQEFYYKLKLPRIFELGLSSALSSIFWKNIYLWISSHKYLEHHTALKVLFIDRELSRTHHSLAQYFFLFYFFRQGIFHSC